MASFRTKTSYMGDCQRCSTLFEGDGAMRSAQKHFKQCGGYISVCAMVTYVWDPDRHQPATATEDASDDE